MASIGTPWNRPSASGASAVLSTRVRPGSATSTSTETTTAITTSPARNPIVVMSNGIIAGADRHAGDRGAVERAEDTPEHVVRDEPLDDRLRVDVDERIADADQAPSRRAPTQWWARWRRAATEPPTERRRSRSPAQASPVATTPSATTPPTSPPMPSAALSTPTPLSVHVAAVRGRSPPRTRLNNLPPLSERRTTPRSAGGCDPREWRGSPRSPRRTCPHRPVAVRPRQRRRRRTLGVGDRRGGLVNAIGRGLGRPDAEHHDRRPHEGQRVEHEHGTDVQNTPGAARPPRDRGRSRRC